MSKKRLNQKAMLTQLSFSVWTGRVKDNIVSSEVTTQKNADKDSGTWWTYLIPRSAIKNINTAYSKCKATHNRYTLPWRDGGYRILPTAMFLKYSKAMREVKADFNETVEQFLKDYPNYRANAHKRLGKLLKHKILPTVAEIRGRFGVYQNIFPLPSSADFRVDLAEEDVKEIKKEMKASIDSTIQKAMSTIWYQLIELVEKIEATLGKPKKSFKNSLIKNLTNFCELIPELNLTNDPKLEDIRKEVVKKLTNLKPDNLRDDKRARKVGYNASKDLLKKMKAFKKL